MIEVKKMVLNNISVPIETTVEPRQYTVKFADNSFPFTAFTIGVGSYIVNAQIQSAIDTNNDMLHNLAIGKYCALADSITFLIDVSHNYLGLAVGSIRGAPSPANIIHRKGQIIIQNDVWIGHGATIMSGVTVHNGACIAANSHVVKDVPPYAIVGGNPAKVIKYRFTNEQIFDLLNIAWWDWSDEVLVKRKVDFALNIQDFIGKYRSSQIIHEEKVRDSVKRALFFPDFNDPYPIWKRVIAEYLHNLNDSELGLLLYLDYENDIDIHIAQLTEFIKEVNGTRDDNILLEIDKLKEESSLFHKSDYYITTRAFETVRRSSMADRFGIKTLSGFDIPIFKKGL